MVDCPECGRSFDSSLGFNAHWGAKHDGPVPDVVDNSIPSEVKEKISDTLTGSEGPWRDVPTEEMPMYGKSHSEETKQKIREAARGRTISDEQRERISRTLRGQSGYFPADEEYSDDWQWVRKQVRKRDNYRCVRCRIPEYALPRELSVHHINRKKDSVQMANLVSLCNSCHAKSQFNPFFYSSTS